jgi:hypothetical protein
LETGRPNVMLDPALLLGRTALENTVGEVAALQDQGEFAFSVASSLAAEDLDPEAEEPLFGFFDAAGDAVHPQEAVARLQEIGVPTWAPPAGAREEYTEFYGALGEVTESSIVRDLLFEEWFFLTHESWVISRIKSPFVAMVDAGELGVEVLNKLVRRTLKQPASDTVRTVDRLRALGKWAAVGGPPALILLNPIVGAVATGVAGGFLLLDPPPPSEDASA